MAAYDEIITVWKQTGAAGFRRELGLVARDAGVTERALAKLGLQMQALGRIKPARPVAPGRIPSIPGMPGGGGGGGATIINTTSVNQSTTAVRGLSNSLISLAASAGGLYAVQRVVGYVADSAGKVQMATIAFKTLLGSADAAKRMVSDIQTFAANTPFNFSGALRSAQQLKAMGFSAKEIIPTMTTLGDSVAALGGDSDIFGRIAYNLGQIRTQGKATAIDIRQFQMAGMDIYAILKAATGQMYTLSDVTAMTADTLIPNLLKGMNKLYGGTMKNAKGTIPQSLSNMTDSFEQLGATVGQKLTPVFVRFAKGATAVANALKTIAENSNAATYAMSAVAVGGTAFGIKKIWDAVSARRSLTRQVLEDVAAEKTKTGVAGAEADAIGRGTRAVKNATTARRGLVGLISRSRAWMGGAFELGGKAFQPPMALRGAFGGRGIGGQFFARGGARTAGLITRGGAALGAGLGAAAGFQSYDNWRAVGDSVGMAATKATVTGISAGLVATFVPGGAIAVAAGETLAWAINKYVNKPMEDAAVNDNPTAETGETKGMTPEQRASFYRKKGMDELAKEPSLWDRIRNSNFVRDGRPGSYDNSAASESFRRARLITEEARRNRSRAATEAEAKRDAERQAQNRKEAEQKAFNDLLNKPSSDYSAGPAARKGRNSDWIIRLPASPADKSYDRRRYNNQTPMPSLAR